MALVGCRDSRWFGSKKVAEIPPLRFVFRSDAPLVLRRPSRADPALTRADLQGGASPNDQLG